MSLPDPRRLRTLGAVALLCASAFARADDLASVYTRALDGNPSYQSALAAYQQALEAKPQALAKLLPQIAVAGNAAYAQQTSSGQYFVDTLTPGGPGINVDQSDTFYQLGYTVGLSQVVFRRELLLGLDQAELQVGRAGVANLQAQNVLRVQVAETYFGALGADDELQYAQQQRAAIGSVLEQTRSRAASGLVAQTEVEAATAQFQFAEAEVIAARNGVAVARAGLALLAGSDAKFNALKRLATNFQPTMPAPLDTNEWVTRARTQNLAVQSQAFGVQLASKELDIARAKRWPTVDAGASRSYSFADGGVSRGIGAGNNHESDMRVGAQVKLPIFTGGAIESGIRAATAGVARAEADEKAAQAAAVQLVQTAYFGAESGIAKISALKQSLSSAVAAEDSTRVGYEVGTRTSADLLLAVRTRYKVERDYAKARYDFLLDTLRLRSAAGTLNHSDFLAVNQLLN